MSDDGTDAKKDDAQKKTGSRRSVQTEADRALEILVPTAAKFQAKLAEMIRGHENFKLRLEISGDRGRVTEVDLNEFTKRRPASEPKPTGSD